MTASPTTIMSSPRSSSSSLMDGTLFSRLTILRAPESDRPATPESPLHSAALLEDAGTSPVGPALFGSSLSSSVSSADPITLGRSKSQKSRTRVLSASQVLAELGKTSSALAEDHDETPTTATSSSRRLSVGSQMSQSTLSEPIRMRPIEEDILLPFANRQTEILELLQQPRNVATFNLMCDAFAHIDPAKGGWSKQDFLDHLAVPRQRMSDKEWSATLKAHVACKGESLYERLRACIGIEDAWEASMDSPVDEVLQDIQPVMVGEPLLESHAATEAVMSPEIGRRQVDPASSPVLSSRSSSSFLPFAFDSPDRRNDAPLPEVPPYATQGLALVSPTMAPPPSPRRHNRTQSSASMGRPPSIIMDPILEDQAMLSPAEPRQGSPELRIRSPTPDRRQPSEEIFGTSASSKSIAEEMVNPPTSAKGMHGVRFSSVSSTTPLYQTPSSPIPRSPSFGSNSPSRGLHLSQANFNAHGAHSPAFRSPFKHITATQGPNASSYDDYAVDSDEESSLKGSVHEDRRNSLAHSTGRGPAFRYSFSTGQSKGGFALPS